jgi:hypothetical protein
MAAEQVELAVSMMDLYPLGYPGQPSWRSYVDRLDDYLEKTGFNSMEVHPTEQTYHDLTVLNETLEDDVFLRSVIGSMHQTFNGGAGLMGVMGRLAKVYETDESYGKMVEMASHIEPIPLVVYPSDKLETAIKQHDAPKSPLVMQPAPEIYRDYEVFSTEALLAKMGSMGIAGLCPDTVHARRQTEDGFEGPAMQDVWTEQFASGCVYQMHVALDRVDMAGRDAAVAAQSHEEFERFLISWKAARHTEIGDMIIDSIQNWKAPADLEDAPLRMVVEIPPLPRDVMRRTKQHRIVCDHLAEIVRYAGATPVARDF